MINFKELKAKSAPFLAQAKTFGNQAVQYVKENPRSAAYDLAAAALAITVLDIEDTLESVEANTWVSAASDLDII